MSSASDFEISEGRLPGLRTVVVEGHGVRCEIAHRGATVLSWRSGHDDIIDGYHDATELGGQDGVRSGILVPFAGRIRDAAYTWNELRHDLRPGSSDRDVFHGVLRESYFELVGVTREPEAARMRFRAVTSRSRHAGYPFPLCSDVDYVVRREGIDVSVSVVNTGESPAPITLGWHPYFRLPSARSVDAITLRVNASSVLVTDAQLLPVHGETRDVTGTSLDFREARIIGTDMIDACFLPAGGADGGRVETQVAGPAGDTVTMWQSSGAVYVYTGDRLARDSRASIAVEAISHVPDAFNDPTARSTVSLAPGASRTFRCGFDYHPAGS
ncbi:MAG TPA: aldose 1-epimerase [Microbacterium sp.]|jgi:aldose 1-epimerase|nr:aldose 1-epimerase [Microbacterium sp.]|tara:strand:- start:2028 stop:3011 length:984 start_codon:yes stop_codon:yes gene_type:complete